MPTLDNNGWITEPGWRYIDASWPGGPLFSHVCEANYPPVRAVPDTDGNMVCPKCGRIAEKDCAHASEIAKKET